MLSAARAADPAITREAFDRLVTGDGAPPVDLVIRTGGEQRLSDFLLWESAYAELHFTPCPWPDFGEAELTAAMTAFRGRQHRFGGLRPRREVPLDERRVRTGRAWRRSVVRRGMPRRRCGRGGGWAGLRIGCRGSLGSPQRSYVSPVGSHNSACGTGKVGSGSKGRDRSSAAAIIHRAHWPRSIRAGLNGTLDHATAPRYPFGCRALGEASVGLNRPL
ncbi:hypothetical protein G4G93_12625 [Methylobacterium sp. DB0501]|nr:hypothetical protein [Methylobacterium sp. DB0501]